MKPSGDEHAGHKMVLPAEFSRQIRALVAAYEHVAVAVQQQDLDETTAAFRQFGEALREVDGSLLTGHSRMLWKEFAMLLGNDAVEGAGADMIDEADRVFLVLKGHIRRMREQLGVAQGHEPAIERIVVGPEFQAELAGIWRPYVEVQQALAGDNFAEARRALSGLGPAIAAVDADSISGRAADAWRKELANLTKLSAALQTARDIDDFRTEFKPLSEEVGVLAKTFGFGDAVPVYELHCPMAFQGSGAVWYQDTDEVRNPYYGSTMLKCADRVERIAHEAPAGTHEHGSHESHSQHEGR